ncbi:Ornithine decarboxylase [Pleosporales sp. CAS-2024a]
MGNNQSTANHHNRLAKPKTNTNSPAPALLTDSPVSVHSRYADWSAKGRHLIKESLLSPADTEAEAGSAVWSSKVDDAMADLAPRTRGRPLSMLSRSNSKVNSRNNSRSNSLSCFGANKHGANPRLQDVSGSNTSSTQMDLEAAIRLLQEVKKNASPDDLAALQEAWEGSNDTALPDMEPSLSRRASAAANASSSSLTRRRSLVQTPGVATRTSPGEGRRRTWNSWKSPHVAPGEEAKWSATPKRMAPLDRRLARTSIMESPKSSAGRAQTPSELDYGHLGNLKLGTLSIVNGEPSPAASMKLPNHRMSGEVDYFAAEPVPSPLVMKSARQRGHVKSKSLAAPSLAPLYRTEGIEGKPLGRPRSRGNDATPQGPRPLLPLRVTNETTVLTGGDANAYALDYQAHIPNSPFATTTTTTTTTTTPFEQNQQAGVFQPEDILPLGEFAAGLVTGTAFDAPTTAIETSGSVLFSAASIPDTDRSMTGPRQRPLPRTADSGYSSGGSLRAKEKGRHSAQSMTSGGSSKNSVDEDRRSSPAVSRDSISPIRRNAQVLWKLDEAEISHAPTPVSVVEQIDRPSTGDSFLLSPSSDGSRFSHDSASANTTRRLQKRRPSQPEFPRVQCCQSVPEASIPEVPENVRATFMRRLSNTPGVECLTHTYPSKDHVLAAASEVSTVMASPPERVVPLPELEPEQSGPAPAHKRGRSLPLFRSKSVVGSQGDQDGGAAAAFARMRSKDRGLAEQQMAQQPRRRSFHNLKLEAGEANMARRRQQWGYDYDIPPVPTIDAAKLVVRPPSRAPVQSEPSASTSTSTLEWDAHAKHWRQRRKQAAPREGLAAWGRFSGGLDYNYEGRGGSGVGGSAGTRSVDSRASPKSMQWKHQYGVDLSDVPVMLQLQREGGSSRVGKTLPKPRLRALQASITPDQTQTQTRLQRRPACQVLPPVNRPGPPIQGMAPSALTATPEYLTLKDSLQSLHRQTRASVEHHGACKSKQLIGAALKSRVEAIDNDTCEVGDEDAFFIADLGDVYRQHLRWKKNLARVKPHYAVKCNPDPQVLRLMSELGMGFDCASKNEIETVLRLGVDPARIIYAQPCKTKSYLRYAANAGVKQMTFDNADELYKTKQLFPHAELFLRILTDDSASLCRLSQKFGASLDTTAELLELAKKLDLNVVGVAFHVGSGASDPKAFIKAVQDARFVFDQAATFGFNMHTLDVGGGFTGDVTFEPMAAVLSASLDEYFPPHIRVIGEPGRYYVSTAFTIACHVIARRTVPDATLGTTSYMLYLNDGVYGNFSSIIFDHQHPVPRVLKSGNHVLYDVRPSGYDTPSQVEYSIWGPTCDGIDIISSSCTFPELLNVGDWLYFEDMGAYTKCSATKFNGFTDSHDVVYVCSEPGAKALLGM